MKVTPAYDAWKNFILVIAGVLAGQTLSSYGEPNGFAQNVQTSVFWLLDFNKVVSVKIKYLGLASTITILTVIYFIKCMHGMIIGIFSDDHHKRLQDGVLEAMLSCSLVTVSIVSLTFVPWLARQVQSQNTIELAAIYLVGMATLPMWWVIPFDIYRAFRDRRGLSIRTLFSEKKEFSQVVDTWIIEDIVSIALILGLVLVLVLGVPGETKIYATVSVLILYLLINSVFDYYANRGFFFDFKPVVTRRGAGSGRAPANPAGSPAPAPSPG